MYYKGVICVQVRVCESMGMAGDTANEACRKRIACNKECKKDRQKISKMSNEDREAGKQNRIYTEKTGIGTQCTINRAHRIGSRKATESRRRRTPSALRFPISVSVPITVVVGLHTAFFMVHRCQSKPESKEQHQFHMNTVWQSDISTGMLHGIVLQTPMFSTSVSGWS